MPSQMLSEVQDLLIWQNPPLFQSQGTQVTPPEKQDPRIRYKDAKNKNGDQGSGPGGYKPPVEPGDKMR